MRKAVFAGTFDPITKGHEAVIKKAVDLFDFLTVAICINPDKKALFSVEKRLEMLNAVLSGYNNVEVVFHQGMLVDLMKEKGIKFNVRGVRNATDYAYENNMSDYNEKLYPEMVTIYFPCTDNLKEVSSTKVRNDVGNGVYDSNCLSEKVIEIIKNNDTK